MNASIQTPAGLNVTQQFAYDLFNRLESATETNSSNGQNWNQNYQYGAWGNRIVSGYTPNFAVTPTVWTQYHSNNQWWGTGASYDSSGNQTSLPSRSFGYDAENRLITSSQPNTGAISYVYDGEGRRAIKTVGTSATVYTYDGDGKHGRLPKAIVSRSCPVHLNRLARIN